jgi:hypothetical protein
MKEYKFMTHLEWIKNKFGFYVELYEQAFTELKLRQKREVERTNMSLCDHESRMFNYAQETSEVARLLHDDVPQFGSYNEAHQYIS